MPKKKGFKSITHIEYTAVNVGSLQALATAGVSEITKEVLTEKGIIRNAEVFIKLLGDGELTSKITVQAEKVSKSAQDKIEKAGGKVEILAK
jgi:large subunit ribosomal protein L15